MTVIKSYVVKIDEGSPAGASVVTDGVTVQGNGTAGNPLQVTDGLYAETEIELVSFATELTFDYDKDLATVTGGTRTFTLAASGHLNGVGIVARINAPVAVNFPVGSEAVEGSSSITTTGMNIIVFRYFENYNGSGTDKVLYLVKNQAAL